MIRHLFFFLILLLILVSCEKNINIKLDPSSTDLVVDGSIENGEYPVIFLSRSLAYFSKIDPHVLTASFVHNATVTLSNGYAIGQLKEDSLVLDSSDLAIYFYTFKNGDPGIFKGDFNTGYSLKIEVDSKTYLATTTIPLLTKTIDSLWWVPPPNNLDSALAVVKARINDPKGLGNYTRYFTSVNSGPFYPGLQSVFDDQVTDGTVYTVSVDKGVNRNEKIDFNTYAFFNRGDSVVVKLSDIDKDTYDFWRTMEYNYQSIGNPFSTPTEVISNISNGALGYFGGYASQYVRLNIPPN